MKPVLLGAILSLALPALALAGGGPPPELLQVEREAALKLAHARDEGYTEPEKLKTFAQAQAADLDAEKALQAGDYQRAESGFLKTKVLLHNLGI
jgi:hypothetical protein